MYFISLQCLKSIIINCSVVVHIENSQHQLYTKVHYYPICTVSHFSDKAWCSDPNKDQPNYRENSISN